MFTYFDKLVDFQLFNDQFLQLFNDRFLQLFNDQFFQLFNSYNCLIHTNLYVTF